VKIAESTGIGKVIGFCGSTMFDANNMVNFTAETICFCDEAVLAEIIGTLSNYSSRQSR
jgi:hypothetical protein